MPEYVLFGLIFVSFFPLKVLPKIYPPMSLKIHIVIMKIKFQLTLGWFSKNSSTTILIKNNRYKNIKNYIKNFWRVLRLFLFNIFSKILFISIQEITKINNNEEINTTEYCSIKNTKDINNTDVNKRLFSSLFIKHLQNFFLIF